MFNGKRSSLFIICAATCWGSIGLATRPLLAMGFDSVQITFLRCTVTAIVLVLFSLFCNRETFKIRGLKNVILLLSNGVIGVACMYLLFFRTIETATLSLASVLLNTAPCFVLIMSCIFFKEKITGKKIAALIIAVTGCVLTTGILTTLAGGSGSLAPMGVLAGLGSGVCYALYTILSNQLLKTYSSLTVITYSFLIGALCLIPVCEFDSMGSILMQPRTILFILLLGIFCTLLPYVLYTFGLKHTEPGKASIMALTEPMVATILSIFYFKEGYSITGLAGIALIFISIIILNVHGKKSARKYEDRTGA